MPHQRRRIQFSEIAAPQSLPPHTAPAQALAPAVVTPFERSRRSPPRSHEVMQAVRNLDMTQDAAYRANLISWIEQAYIDRMGGLLVGLFARCHLGEPYIDHRMTVAGRIVEHYTPSDTVPDLYREARALARSPVYAYIEVYGDGELVPVLEDGTRA